MDTAARARAWVHGAQAAVCDVIEPWEHGTVVRATRHPTYDVVHHLRVAWHREDFPDVDFKDHFDHAREVAMRRNAQVFAAFRQDRPVAFAQLEREGGAAEITDVFVDPDQRGRGLGTAITQAAIEAAGEVSDLWIVADDDDRPKELYARLGFRATWKLLDFLRVPSS